jgi:hypothetical protein
MFVVVPSSLVKVYVPSPLSVSVVVVSRSLMLAVAVTDLEHVLGHGVCVWVHT